MTHLTILRTIYHTPWTWWLTGLTAWCIFTGAVWFPNLSLISTVLGSSVSLLEKLQFLATLYLSIGTNFTVLSASYTVLIALLFGIQLTLLVYYIRRSRTGGASLQRVGGTGLGGLVAGIFGIGCAACGTFLLTSFLSLFGAAGLLSALPLHGAEFGIAGVALLGYSIWLLLQKLRLPAICPLPPS